MGERRMHKTRTIPVVGEEESGVVYKFISLHEILFMNMVNNIPTFYTSDGIYKLANTFGALKNCLTAGTGDDDFQTTDRGVIVNMKKIKKFDHEKMVLNLGRKCYATISEANKNKIIKLLGDKGKRKDLS